jgi:PqqD family protein of HPr-rel-A system
MPKSAHNHSTAYPSINAWTMPGFALPCPQRRPDVKQEILDDEAILFDPITGATFRLNESALEVWDGCRPGRKIDDLTQDMCNRYDIDEDTARDDVEQMVAMFASHGLLNP